MKKIGVLIYFDIVILLVVIRPFLLLIERPLWLHQIAPRLCVILEIAFFLLYIFKKDPKRKFPNMTQFDIKLWNTTEYILYTCLVLFIIIPFLPMLLSTFAYLLFCISVLLYIGVQVHFVRRGKW